MICTIEISVHNDLFCSIQPHAGWMPIAARAEEGVEDSFGVTARKAPCRTRRIAGNRFILLRFAHGAAARDRPPCRATFAGVTDWLPWCRMPHHGAAAMRGAVFAGAAIFTSDNRTMGSAFGVVKQGVPPIRGGATLISRRARHGGTPFSRAVSVPYFLWAYALSSSGPYAVRGLRPDRVASSRDLPRPLDHGS